MKTKTCAACQYFRFESFCSNSQTPHAMKNVTSDFSCAGFIERGSKAPFTLRAQNRALNRLNALLKRSK